jgi:hypothetical protein
MKATTAAVTACTILQYGCWWISERSLSRTGDGAAAAGGARPCLLLQLVVLLSTSCRTARPLCTAGLVGMSAR